VAVLSSRDNARVKRWARLSQDARFRRQERRAVIEGPHLVAALLASGGAPACLIVPEGISASAEIRALLARAKGELVEVSQAVFKAIVDTETPQGIAAEIEIPRQAALSARSCVFLEGIQDAGNVGAIIRSAAAFGIGTVFLDQGCADPWSPKVLRAGMGGHFHVALRSVPGLQEELETFAGKVLCTVAAGGEDLRKAELAGRLGWVFGSEGKGLSEAALAEADLRITIPLSPASESLNVAASAAICFYQAFNTPGAGS
jgi:TrmH family RNA methyltransferase